MKWANHERTVAKKLQKENPNALEHANRIISSNKLTTAKGSKRSGKTTIIFEK